MIKFCPQCYRTYEDPALETCPEDAARLFRRSDKPDDPLVGTVLDRRFRIEKALSEGGMGAVYRATQLSVHRDVALKVVRPELGADDLFMERFFREARVVAELSHPNIVRLIDFGHDSDRDILFLVMELVRGTEMGDLLTRGRIAPNLALDITYQVCAGLTEPHSQGVVHRDLKPANIILVPSSDGTFQVKILDFGIARTAEANTRLTATGMICGTPAYLAPEQAQNEEVDERTDLYSLGVLLFEMLTGHLPFRGPSGLQLLLNHIKRPAPMLAKAYPGIIAQQVSNLVLDLMEKDRDRRPATAMEVRRRVQQVRRQLDISPVFLDDRSGEGVELEEVFSPWILPELDPERLDDVDVQSGPSPAPDPGLLDTIAPDEIPEGSDDEDLALLATLAADGDVDLDHMQTLVADDDSDVALLETLAAGGDIGDGDYDPDLEERDTLVADDEAPQLDAEPPDKPEAADDDALETEELEEADEERSEGASTTGPIEDGSTKRPDLPVARIAAGTIAASAALMILAIFLFSDGTPEPDEPDEPADHVAIADDDDVEDEKAVARPADDSAPPDEDDVDDADDADDAPADDDESSDEDRPVDKDDVDEATPESETAAPSPEDVAEQPDPVEVAEVAEVAEAAVEESDEPDEPGSAQPPTPPADPDDTDGDVHEGSVVLESPSEVEGAQGFGEITGDLVVRINVDGFSELELPNLGRIGGSLVLDPLSQVAEISLPELEEVGGALMINQGNHLNDLQLPQLRSVGTNLMLTSSPLQRLELPALRHIGEMLLFSQNESLSTIELPRLEEVGTNLSVMQNPKLNTLSLPRLMDVGEEFQVLSGALDTIRMQRLRSVGGGVTFNENKTLRTLNLGSLSTIGLSTARPGGLTFNNAEQLDQLDLGSLRRVAGTVVIGSSSLTNLDLSSLQEVGAQLTISSNNSLQSVDLGELTNVDGNLLITAHPALDTLTLQSLQNVDDLLVMNSPQLSACALEELADAMKEAGWDGEARLTNLDESSCG